MNRMTEIQSIWRDYSRFYRALAGVILFILGVIVGAVLFGSDLLNDYATNVYTEGLGVVFTVAVLNYLAREREADRETKRLQERLVRETGSQINITAKRAVEELRTQDWLEGESGLLQGANLHRAHLSHGYLSRAKLNNANLRKSDLSGGVLNRTDLSEANLTEADLSGARLYKANLSGAILNLAKLTNAYVVDVVCDENTILPDGAKWSPDIDWSRFGAFTGDYGEWRAWRDSQQSENGD